MNKVLIPLLIYFSFLGTGLIKNECFIVCSMPNGIYKTVYDDQYSHYENFEFERTTDSLLTESKNFKIKRFDSNGFIRINDFEVTDSTTAFQKRLFKTLKFSYFEIEECGGKEFTFRESPDLHVTSSTGRFIKVN